MCKNSSLSNTARDFKLIEEFLYGRFEIPIRIILVNNGPVKTSEISKTLDACTVVGPSTSQPEDTSQQIESPLKRY